MQIGIPKVVGSRRNSKKLHQVVNILQSKWGKETGASKNGVGTRIKGYGYWGPLVPFPPNNNVPLVGVWFSGTAEQDYRISLLLLFLVKPSFPREKGVRSKILCLTGCH